MVPPATAMCRRQQRATRTIRSAAVQRGKAEFGVDLVEPGAESCVGTDGGVQFDYPRHDEECLFAHAAPIVPFVYVARVAIVT